MVCHGCGDVIHVTPAYGPDDRELSMAALDRMLPLIYGDPPRCAECRLEGRAARVVTTAVRRPKRRRRR
jgi:hypothetical protein